MNEDKSRGEQRADEARRTDDSDIVERMEDAPAQGGRSGHRVGHDIGTQDELKQAVGEGGVTRVRNADKPEEGDLPRYNDGGDR